MWQEKVFFGAYDAKKCFGKRNFLGCAMKKCFLSVIGRQKRKDKRGEKKLKSIGNSIFFFCLLFKLDFGSMIHIL